MNEWPIDESFVDYVVGSPLSGIVNDPQDYPQINAQVIAASDEKGGIENLSTGYHAVEFLLWGQRPDQTSGPGERPYTDYVDGGTAANQDRRRTYLKVASQLLLDDMRALEAQWDLDNKTSYGAMFVADKPQASLTKMFRGFSQMAISELYYERLDDPFASRDQKDEESCFSESTIGDLINNALGVEDAYLGRYQAMQGPSISDLVKAKAPALDAQIRQQLSDIRSGHRRDSAAVRSRGAGAGRFGGEPGGAGGGAGVRAAAGSLEPGSDGARRREQPVSARLAALGLFALAGGCGGAARVDPTRGAARRRRHHLRRRRRVVRLSRAQPRADVSRRVPDRRRHLQPQLGRRAVDGAGQRRPRPDLQRVLLLGLPRQQRPRRATADGGRFVPRAACCA